MDTSRIDPALRHIFGDESSAPLNGSGTDTDVDPVGQLIHQQEYGIKPPAPAPARKHLTVEQIEDALAARRAERRKSLIAQQPTFFSEAREQIKTFCREHRAEIVAAGSFEKLFG